MPFPGIAAVCHVPGCTLMLTWEADDVSDGAVNAGNEAIFSASLGVVKMEIPRPWLNDVLV